MTDSALIVFTLLSCMRHGYKPTNLWMAFKRRGLQLRPRLSFWLALCRQAALLNDYNHPAPFLHEWLKMPPAMQSMHLLEAWLGCPGGRKRRLFRKRILHRLKCDLPLQKSDRHELPGLLALGLCNGERRTAWGRVILGLDPAPSQTASVPWYVEGDRLIVGVRPDWSMLWKLEAFLEPVAPGVYPLGAPSLRRAAQRGSLDQLIGLLERGLGAPLGPDMLTRITGQPSLTAQAGLVLEFSAPEELACLRRSPVMRRHFEHLLSPRHVLVTEEAAPRLLILLERRGVYIRYLQESDHEVALRRTRLWEVRPSSHLRCVVSGDRQPSLLDLLKEYLRLGEALDISYTAPNCQPELRRITPLAIEQRGGHEYVIAYCQTRRGNRTFRVDRMRAA
jgi:hypothetical protein